MKIVSFTMVNNESELIESFIRYNSNFVDMMVIIDNGCTDSTIAILRNLISEGYNIKIFDESLAAYDQFRLDNKYIKKIIQEFTPDLIIPLDADEFISSEGNPRTILEELTLDRIYYVYWKWYVLTDKDIQNEQFIPKRINHCLADPPRNFSGGDFVTKAIIPARYFIDKGLTLSMGHHQVYGNENLKVDELISLNFAHYRVTSKEQVVYKTLSYTIRDISTMDNNHETAQRTNQLAAIEAGKDMMETAIDISYGGYQGEIRYSPLSTRFCDLATTKMKYTSMEHETLSKRLLWTGREMAIRAYNAEREKKEKRFLKPVVFWLDGIRFSEIFFPNPSNHLTACTEFFNIRAYLTTKDEIKYLKSNYRLIVGPEMVKFIPHEYIVIPAKLDFVEIRNELVKQGIDESKIISLKDYRSEIGYIRNIYSYIMFVPSAISRINKYIKRNGFKKTLRKIKSRR